MRARSLLRGAGFLAAMLLLDGCATQSEVQVVAPQPTGQVVQLRLEPCADRTGTTDRDLATEATRLLSDRLRATPGIEVRDDAPLVLNCEVTQYRAGSAMKRWVMPGWGATVGQLAVMVSSTKDQSVVAIIQGNAVVAAGGLYTVGAEDYILASAADDVIARLREWAAGPDAAGKR